MTYRNREKTLRGRGKYFLKFHLHIVLYTYFWFGLFVCGLLAPPHRVAELGSDLVSRGWQLSLLSVFLIFPVPLIYLVRMRRGALGTTEPETGERGEECP